MTTGQSALEITSGQSPRAQRAAQRPELLAPAGDQNALRAAIENGADAVYFGLERHNARFRAQNFSLADLPATVAEIHRRGVRAYVTLNTLAFTHELAELESIVRAIASAGVDAVIVQDLGLVRLIRQTAPGLEIHASTQMSITSAAGVNLAAELGCSRVILARELSLREIERIRLETTLPFEVFVHGALCVAYSGQCLTSESLGGRSANRGECAQACRMPYTIVCDGRDVDLGDVQFLLSPQDLAAYDLLPQLIDLGVASFKIEGRLKAPEYVASITRHYRQALDAAWNSRSVTLEPEQVAAMELTFSRGFSHGFLDGTNHKVLVRGDYAKKRGLALGVIERVTRLGVQLRPRFPIKPGDGLVFDGDERTGRPEQGGRVYEVLALDDCGGCELRFGRGDIDLSRLEPTQRVWKTDDPELTRQLRSTFEGKPARRMRLDLVVHARSGEPLRITGRTAAGRQAQVVSAQPLSPALNRPADLNLLREQLGRLGGTVYELGSIDAQIADEPLIPKSLLNDLRRQLVEQLDHNPPAAIAIAPEPVLPRWLAHLAMRRTKQDQLAPARPDELIVLCRRIEQIPAALACGITTIEADFQDIKLYAPAVKLIREHSPGVRVYLASPRIEKPGEANLFPFLARQGADGLLVRNAGGLDFCRRRLIPFIADFSLNAANPLAVQTLIDWGASRATASYDLAIDQLLDLVQSVPAGWIEVVIHQHMPMFHMEHCVFCAFLSPGTDATNCGRPCDTHLVSLRDRAGVEHPLRADVGCRNTLYNATAQSAAEYLPALAARGVCHLRVELLDEDETAARRLIGLYQDVLAGRRQPRALWRELKAANQYGVTRGPLAVLS